MDFTVTVSNAFRISPFNVMNQDKDDVIMMINYYLEKAETAQPTEKQKDKINNQGRIRVNDKTATGGWF